MVRTEDEDDDAYFATRPREAQLGAWASRQSAPIEDREELEARLAEMTARFPAARCRARRSGAASG